MVRFNVSPHDPLRNLVKSLRYQPSPAARDRLFEKVHRAMDETGKPMSGTVRCGIGRTLMSHRNRRLAAAAAAIIVIVGGVQFWPFGRSENGQWWLGPAPAWGQQILASLDKVRAVVYRQRVGTVSDYNPPEMSIGWERRYNTRDRYRRDRYDDGVNIMNTQWVIPDGNGLLMLEVSYEYKCTFQRENQAYGFIKDFVGEMSSYVQLLEKADRLLGTEVFDGCECVGFEVSAAKYGDNPQGRFDRIWFDIRTRLPARIERHGIPSGHRAGETMIIIHDEFQYNAEVPADLFVPVIPEGFVNAHPDDVSTARDAEAKGPMVFAQMPDGLKDKVISALKQVEAGRFRKGQTRITFSKTAWRQDRLSERGLQEVTWHVLDPTAPEGPFEVPNSPGAKETVVRVDYTRKTFSTIEPGNGSPPRHPMTQILFLVGMMDKADRFIEQADIDGITCFGFEISAKKYGDNPDGMLHRVWLDAATNLPARSEFIRPRDDGFGTDSTVHDDFQWNIPLPEDFFVPQEPPGFVPITE